MNRAVMPITDYENTCDKIREKTETTDLIKSGELPEKIEEVYEAGQVTGRKTEYDRFWDEYQRNGTRYGYYYAFAGSGWNDETFKPKYDIVLKGSNIYAFSYCEVTDLVNALEKLGVSLDTSLSSSNNHMFYNAQTKRLPPINLTGQWTVSGVFCDCQKLESIEKIIVAEKNKFADAFTNCSNLKNITFEGVIGQNGLSFGNSPLLTHESLLNIIDCLKDFRETVIEHRGVNVSMPHILTTSTLVEGAKYYLTYEGDNFDSYTAEATAGQVTVMPSGISALGLEFEMPSQTSGDIPLIWVYQDGENLMYDAYFGGISNAKITLSKAPTEKRTVTLGANNLAKLTDAEKVVATQKGWTLL